MQFRSMRRGIPQAARPNRGTSWSRSVLDAIPNDFIQGLIERLVLDALADADVIVIEGQGSIFHPGFSGLPVALMHVVAPQWLVLCHRLG